MAYYGENIAEEAMQLAQVLGARLTKDCFFPRWKVMQFLRSGHCEIHRNDNEGRPWYVVIMRHPTTSEELKDTIPEQTGTESLDSE